MGLAVGRLCANEYVSVVLYKLDLVALHLRVTRIQGCGPCMKHELGEQPSPSSSPSVLESMNFSR